MIPRPLRVQHAQATKAATAGIVSEEEHEVAYLMRTAKVTWQKALEAIGEAGPSREKVMEYLEMK